MKKDLIIELMNSWDAMNNAAQRILVSQPGSMTEAASRLDTARMEMQTVINKFCRIPAPGDEQEPKL